jgi:hypothetical protein
VVLGIVVGAAFFLVAHLIISRNGSRYRADNFVALDFTRWRVPRNMLARHPNT